MKILNFIFIALLLTISSFGQNINQPVKVSTTAVEINILDEINEARTNPTKYIAYLQEYKQLFRGNTVYFPNGTRMITVEGTKAVDEAINFLKALPKTEPLKFSNGLSKPASLQIADLIEDSSLGHTSKDGSDLAKRLAKFGFVGNIYAESLIQYVQNPREMVLTMLIDDGLKSRGNRKNILSSKFKQIGIAVGKDRKGDSLCIAIFTDSFQEKNSNVGSFRIY